MLVSPQLTVQQQAREGVAGLDFVSRRSFLFQALFAAAPAIPGRLLVPVRLVVDSRAKAGETESRRFREQIWPEAMRDLSRCGIQVDLTETKGEIGRSPADNPTFKGVAYHSLNVVLTDRVPFKWDNGKELAGLTTVYEGYHLCLVSLANAHRHQVPFVSTNTCIHEMLHAFMGDIFSRRPSEFTARTREFEIDWYATNLWLFHAGAKIREAAGLYLKSLQAGARGV